MKSTLDKVVAKEKKRQPKPRPEDAFTSTEYAAHVGIGIHQAQRRLKQLAEGGSVIPVTFEVTNINGVIRKQPGWQLVEVKNDSGTKRSVKV